MAKPVRISIQGEPVVHFVAGTPAWTVAGMVHAVMICDARSLTVPTIMRERNKPGSMVCSGSFRSCDVSGFRHERINCINGIENFRNQAKRHLRRYDGIPCQQSLEDLAARSKTVIIRKPSVSAPFIILSLFT